MAACGHQRRPVYNESPRSASDRFAVTSFRDRVMDVPFIYGAVTGASTSTWLPWLSGIRSQHVMLLDAGRTRPANDLQRPAMRSAEEKWKTTFSSALLAHFPQPDSDAMDARYSA